MGGENRDGGGAFPARRDAAPAAPEEANWRRGDVKKGNPPPSRTCNFEWERVV